uniref:cytochrome c oxidase subunit II n=1 Tax=Parasaissetia nigra TaxID=1069709 RepID=UPI00220631A3|nr:cytochrome c oxidase subunit II [Parasaissetia nigra]UXW93661.1 cytochrome c oxidase subunit II [Parasaissetia nigra]
MKTMMMYSFKMNESNTMINMNKLTDKMMLIMMLLLMLVSMSMVKTNNMMNKSVMENQKMEMAWTIFPSLIIILMAIMSIPILYLNNEPKMSMITIKILSNQWFWSYEYSNFNTSFNSYMMYKKKFNFNILETDNKLILPFNMPVMMMMTSSDVVHSWAVPSMNVKMDNIPGQTNTLIIRSNKMGVTFGQCSEVCGTNHSFMPVMIETVNTKNFIEWIKK